VSGSSGVGCWRIARAFLRRDVLNETSYKLQSVFHLLSVGFQVLIFYFMARMVGGERTEEYLASYGGDYFSFALVGISFMGLFEAGLVRLTTSIRNHLTSGALEAMAATPTGSGAILTGSLLFPMLFECAKSCLYLFLGHALLGAQLGLVAPIELVLAVLLCLLVFGSLGAIASSLIVYFKRGDPLAWFLSSATALVGGVLFPTSVLPAWLEALAQLLPVPYALDALRATLIPGADDSALWANLGVLALFALGLVPLARLVTRRLFDRARAEGSLGLH